MVKLDLGCGASKKEGFIGVDSLPQPLKVVEEIYRICKKDALVAIAVPYFRSYYATIDPTHVNFFGLNWFNYFDPSHPFQKKYQYSNAKFKVEKISFDKEWKKRSWFYRHLIKLAEKKPAFYEAQLSHLFPLNFLTFYLKVLK